MACPIEPRTKTCSPGGLILTHTHIAVWFGLGFFGFSNNVIIWLWECQKMACPIEPRTKTCSPDGLIFDPYPYCCLVWSGVSADFLGSGKKVRTYFSGVRTMGVDPTWFSCGLGAGACCTAQPLPLPLVPAVNQFCLLPSQNIDRGSQ